MKQLLYVGMLLMLSMVVFGACPASMSGSGIDGDACVITDWTQLQAMNDVKSNWYELGNDLDSGTSGYANYQSGNGFLPIGTQASPFTGMFDGNNHTINGLYINRTAYSDIGLFGFVNNAVTIIKNVGLVGGSVSGHEDVGGLIGQASNMDYISNCYTSMPVIATGIVSGGLVGHNNPGADIYNSYAKGDVYGPGRSGGLVGANYGAHTFNNSYATGDVSATSYAGGFLGMAMDPTIINNCYSLGSVGGTTYSGGFVGYQTGTNAVCNNCFWDTQTSGEASSVCAATGKTTAAMKSLATFTDTATVGLTTAWDFVDNPNDDVANDDIWDIEYSYPVLWSDTLTVPIYTEFSGDGDTTDFSSIDVTAVVDPVLADSNVKVEWTGTLDLDGTDLDSVVQFNSNFVSVDSAALAVLNTVANITLKDTSYNSVDEYYILKDGVACGDCIKHSANPAKFEVSGFSNYTTGGNLTAIPEFSTMTLGIGLIAVLVGLVLIRRKK